ncbi:MAG: BMC domain-containing protein [bacterium]
MQLALGLIETVGLVGAIEAADAMLKAANVKLVSKEKITAAMVTIEIVGEVAAVRAAVDAGAAAAKRVGQLLTAHVIPRPDDQLEPFIKNLELKPAPEIKRGRKKAVSTVPSFFDTAISTENIEEAEEEEETHFSLFDEEGEAASGLFDEVITESISRPIEENLSKISIEEQQNTYPDNAIPEFESEEENIDNQYSFENENNIGVDDSAFYIDIPINTEDGNSDISDFIADEYTSAPIEEVDSLELENISDTIAEDIHEIPIEDIIQDDIDEDAEQKIEIESNINLAENIESIDETSDIIEPFESIDTPIIEEEQKDNSLNALPEEIVEENLYVASNDISLISEDFKPEITEEDLRIQHNDVGKETLEKREISQSEETGFNKEKSDELGFNSSFDTDNQNEESIPLVNKASVFIPLQEDLEKMNVHDLRHLARSIAGFPIKGRQISKANRPQLIEYFNTIR